jgi:hypothetical protein
MGVAMLGAAALGMTFAFPLAYALWGVVRPAALAAEDRRLIYRLPAREGRPGPVAVQRRHVAGAWLKHDAHGLVLTLPAAPRDGRRLLELHGDEARQVVERTLVTVNRADAHPVQVDAAVAALTRLGGADTIRTLLGDGKVLTRGRPDELFGGFVTVGKDDPALSLTATLTLEMALHEETERRAMEGELVLLERAWREAEEIAAIADRLAVPAAGASTRTEAGR